MSVVDLGTPPPRPAGLLDALPRRVTLTLPELRLVAERAGGAPLPFDEVSDDPAGAPTLEGRLGATRSSTDAALRAAALASLPDPGTSLSRRGLLVGPPGDGVVDEGLLGAVGLLATPTLALDLDVAVAGAQARAWHRRSGDAVAALSTSDGLVFELAWFPTTAWAGEVARVAVLPEDLPLRDSDVPDLDLPYELADAGAEAVRTHRADLLPVLVAQHAGEVVTPDGDPVPDAEAAAALGALAEEAQGRVRALVADVSGRDTTVVGVVAWTLLADGWRSLTPVADDDGLRVRVRRVEPDRLAAELAPVIALVETGRPA
ncbi:hypothetical protein [Nocardioides sp. SYSU D00038]|uniref:hypothetical protein n=1 Tax=Nocardioides sp. SYSU D00038 TaxID=2812554 RepID=UPI00196842CF|nr:hypothetical protein [Nocardioides sp. SYSU D00038]